MKKRFTILFRLMVSSLLLALFISVHVVKLLHHHASTSINPKQLSSTADIIKADSSCLVCDYHFTKDTDNNTSTVTIAVITSYPPHFVSPTLRFTSSIGLAASDRGPPAHI